MKLLIPLLFRAAFASALLSAFASVIALGGCEGTNATPQETPTLPPPPSAPTTTGYETALLSVSLFADATARIEMVVPKQVAFVEPLVAFDARLHAPQRERLHVDTSPLAATGPGALVPGSGAVGVQNIAPVPQLPPGPSFGAIVIRHPSQPLPRVARLDWGRPGEGGGDVADRWQSGAVIWRAPYYGPGTHYSIVRTTPGEPEILARAVAP